MLGDDRFTEAILEFLIETKVGCVKERALKSIQLLFSALLFYAFARLFARLFFISSSPFLILSLLCVGGRGAPAGLLAGDRIGGLMLVGCYYSLRLGYSTPTIHDCKQENLLF